MFIFNKNKKTDKKQQNQIIKETKTNTTDDVIPFYKKPIVYLICSIFLIFVILSTLIAHRMFMFFGFGDNATKNIPIVYIQNNQLMYKNQLMDKPAVADSDLHWNTDFSNLNNSTKLNKDGTYMLYLDNIKGISGDLFLKYTLKDIRKNRETKTEGKKIGENVNLNNFIFTNKKNRIVFLDNNGTLYFYERNNSYKIDNNVLQIIGVDSNNILYYLKTSSDKYSKNKLMTFDANSKNSTPKQIDEDVVALYSFDDNSKLLYLQNNTDRQNENILKKYDGDKITTLCEKSEQIIDVGNEDQVFFTKKNRTINEYSLLFKDTNNQDDFYLAKPTEEEYTKEKTNIFGIEKKEFDKKGYEAALTKYQDKLKRDKIREELKKQYNVVETLTFLYKTGTSETFIADNIEKIIFSDANNASSVYEIQTFTLQEQFDINDFDTPEAAINAITQAINDEKNYRRVTYFNKIGYKPMAIAENTVVIDAYLDKDNYLYYTFIDGKKTSLAYRVFENGTLSEQQIINDNIMYLYPNLYQDRVIGLAKNKDYTELFTLNQGKQSTIIKKKQNMELENIIDDTLLIKSNYIPNRDTGDLLIYNTKERTIDENIYKTLHKTDKYIYALKNYDSVLGGDLYLYNNKKKELLGSGVTDILENIDYGISAKSYYN